MTRIGIISNAGSCFNERRGVSNNKIEVTFFDRENNEIVTMPAFKDKFYEATLGDVVEISEDDIVYEPIEISSEDIKDISYTLKYFATMLGNSVRANNVSQRGIIFSDEFVKLMAMSSGFKNSVINLVKENIISEEDATIALK